MQAVVHRCTVAGMTTSRTAHPFHGHGTTAQYHGCDCPPCRHTPVTIDTAYMPVTGPIGLYRDDAPILESVFADVAPDAADLSEVFGWYPRRAYTYAELVDTVADGYVF